jgi:release factor glutamine methyltransferase
MLTVLEIIKRTTDFLAGKGVESARLNAETLIGHALGLKRMALYMQFERPLLEADLEKIRPLVKRRSLREPLQYIVGETDFYGLKLKVDRRALIPRPETEMLVELVVDTWTKEHAPTPLVVEVMPEAATEVSVNTAEVRTDTAAAGTEATTAATGTEAAEIIAAVVPPAVPTPVASPKAPTAILDLGTGSGAIALALAQTYPAAKVTALDASEDALALAKENATQTGLQERVSFVQSNWFERVPAGATFEMIVANPPYLSAQETAETTPEVRGFEPASALTAADNGLADLRAIVATAPGFLASGGLLALETGIAQHAELLKLMTAAGLVRGESRKDLTGRERFVLGWKA